MKERYVPCLVSIYGHHEGSTKSAAPLALLCLFAKARASLQAAGEQWSARNENQTRATIALTMLVSLLEARAISVCQ